MATLKTIFGSNTADDYFYNGADPDQSYWYAWYQNKDKFSYVADDGDLKLVGRGGNDTMVLESTHGLKTVDAGAGDDDVSSTNQTRLIVRLGSGDDGYSSEADAGVKINGGSGDDVFYIEGRGNAYFGEAGSDRFGTEYGSKNIFNGGAGIDFFAYLDPTLEAWSPANINLDKGFAGSNILVSIENAAGGTWKDRLVGSRVANELSGGDSDDVLIGLGGNDILYGEGDASEMQGWGSADRLVGGTGNDKLIGGEDADVLEGGAGRDIFIFLAASDARRDARDTIKDFRTAEHDRIDLSLVDGDTTAKGRQGFDFIGKTAFTGEAGELNFRFGLLSGDLDGDRIADFQVKLLGAAKLSGSDFLF